MYVGFSIISIFPLTSFFLAVYYGLKINTSLNMNKDQMIPKTRLLQKQLQYTLFIQTLGPLITGTIPGMALFVLSFMRFQNETICLITSNSFIWITVVKPLAAIILIKPYRMEILKKFKMVHDSQHMSTGVLSGHRQSKVGTLP